jgi:hypothetical protein
MSEPKKDPEPTSETGSAAPASASPSAGQTPEGYSTPLPKIVPRPTWWPASAALAVMLIGWGLITSLTIFLIGAALLTTSIAGWIGEIRYERNEA